MKGCVQCINCRKKRRCLLVAVHVPIPIGSLEHDRADLGGTYRVDTWEVDESLRVAICRPCLRSDFSLGPYLAEHAR